MTDPLSQQAPVVPVTELSLARAAQLLRDGRLVVFPTETVYGLGADATNDRAVASIYAAKGRPQFNPLIVHVANISALDPLVEMDERARLLATQFWPGPLTLVLKRKDTSPTSLLVSAGMDTIAVRVPSHPVAQKLLQAVGIPIAAPSANPSGKLSPTTPAHVVQSLGDRVDLILAGGRSQVGVESTVVDLVAEPPTILRHGGITREQLDRLIGPTGDVDQTRATTAPRAPGMLASHYAPDLPLRLNAISADQNEAVLTFGPDTHFVGGKVKLNLSENGDLYEAAANLFAMLRALDKAEYSGIAVMPIPTRDLGAAINDRLTRAAVR